jgi:predicted dienelactone hydrolase
VLDAVLANPEWGQRIPTERIGAVGHSAGAYSVLALAGAQADRQRSAQHCRTVQDDPGYCTLAKGPGGADPAAAPGAGPASPAAPDGQRVAVADHRIRAVVALAPMAVVFTPESLAAIKVPVRIIMAEHDAVLNGKYHGQYVGHERTPAPARPRRHPRPRGRDGRHPPADPRQPRAGL